jgi:hypothetical protein
MTKLTDEFLKATKPTIKFNHYYPKLWGQTSAELLAVRRIDIPNELCEELRLYDAKYIGAQKPPGSVWFNESHYYDEFYPLPSGDCLQLIFLGDKRIPFCTIRKKTKEAYYRSRIGEIFQINIEDAG